VRQAEVRLGALWLWFFLPQVVLYGVGALASALLHARRRFAAAAFAPVANNVVVIATMAVFWSLRGGAGHLRGAAGLHLSTAQRLVLGAGTTAGVLAMVAVPVVALARSGARLRPRPVRRDDAQLRAVGRVGLWGAVFLGATQVLVATTLVLANQVQGGVVAYQIAFTFFLLPHAVLAHPVFTALYPRLAAHGVAGRWGEFADQLGSGIRLTAFLVLPAAAVLAAVSGPLLRLVRVGALDAAGVALVARVLTAYLAGLAGYAMLLLLVRAATAAGRARAAAGVGLAMAVAGAGLMVVAAGLTSGTDRVVALALAHSAVVTAGAVALFAVLRRRVGVAVPVGATLARSVVASAAGGLAAWLVAGLVPSGAGIVHAAAAVALGGGAGLVAVVAGQAALRAPELAWRRPAPAAP
jgi:putative peptidoglycan lipid II flippase